VQDSNDIVTIIEQLFCRGINVVLGTGSSDRDLVDEGIDIPTLAAEKGYTLVRTKAELNSAKAKYVWGDFSDFKGNSDGLSHDYDRSENEPSLSDMTYKAIDLLKNDNDGFSLKIPETDFSGRSYPQNPLCYSYLYYGRAGLPAAEVVSDTSSIIPVVQKIIDGEFGKDNAVAKVRVAVCADIDGDGSKETVVNADNSAEEYEESYGDIGDDAMDKYWYSIAFILENDGSVIVIDKYYYNPEDESDDELDFLYVQNIIDIDGDGKYEIVEDWDEWEVFGALVYKYDGEKCTEVLHYSDSSGG
jgi:hypothetical protein